MNLSTSQAVYTALKTGLTIPVSRSWPQSPPGLPGCTFHLHSWVRKPDGAAELSFKIILRVNFQEEGDRYTEQALTAMLTLGYVLWEASDGIEEDTGVFLRTLIFTGVLSAPTKPPDASPDFHLSVFGEGAWHSLPEPAVFTLEPAARELISPQSPLSNADLLPPFALKTIKPATLLVKAPYAPDLTAVRLLRAAFRAGDEVLLKLSYRLPALPETISGALVSFHASVLGVYAKFALRGL